MNMEDLTSTFLSKLCLEEMDFDQARGGERKQQNNNIG